MWKLPIFKHRSKGMLINYRNILFYQMRYKSDCDKGVVPQFPTPKPKYWLEFKIFTTLKFPPSIKNLSDNCLVTFGIITVV